MSSDDLAVSAREIISEWHQFLVCHRGCVSLAYPGVLRGPGADVVVRNSGALWVLHGLLNASVW
jgi:hypothetical protein